MHVQYAGTLEPPHPHPPTTAHNKHAHTECWDSTATVRRTPAHPGAPSQAHSAHTYPRMPHSQLRVWTCAHRMRGPIHPLIHPPPHPPTTAHTNMHTQNVGILLLRFEGHLHTPAVQANPTALRAFADGDTVFRFVWLMRRFMREFPREEFGVLINIHSCFSVLEAVLTKVRELSYSCPPFCVPSAHTRACNTQAQTYLFRFVWIMRRFMREFPRESSAR